MVKIRTVAVLFFVGFIIYGCSSRLPAGQTDIFADFLPGISPDEKTLTLRDQPADVIVHINAPANPDPRRPTKLIYFALPNGNSIEWTAGKKMTEGDDWHYDIQHIGAQTRYLRYYLNKENIITVYLATKQKSWPAWKKAYPDYAARIQELVSSVNQRFVSLKPKITLNSHSGGGSFIFGYMDGVDDISKDVERIAFIDSNYGYEEKYNAQLSRWLKTDARRYLSVLAYNDSVVVYNGKPLVSPTGGTWYRSKLMLSGLQRNFEFKVHSDTSFIRANALNGRIDIILKQNPAAQIFHTHQVGLNGFLQSNLSGTTQLKKVPFTYFGPPAYQSFISNEEEKLSN